MRNRWSLTRAELRGKAASELLTTLNVIVLADRNSIARNEHADGVLELRARNGARLEITCADADSYTATMTRAGFVYQITFDRSHLRSATITKMPN
jgi:hypothetical protein